MKNESLVEKATHGNSTLTENELDLLWIQANNAMHEPKGYGAAFAAVEALLCQADSGNIVRDMVADVRLTPCAAGRTAPMTQGLVDRINSLNWHVAHRNRRQVA